ncbi:MAG: methyltransferase [Nocardiopsaceae bacterium]|nr:methyltransferase [Nocardiopsaceae bacterium]
MNGHYFDASPEARHRPGLVRAVLPDVYLELETDSGVFSPGRLDPGTRFLLESGPPPPEAGDLLDLGCGYGPIACALAQRSPNATVWAVDVNERARDLCARNAEAAGLANLRCLPPDSPGLPGRFDGLWSNPPIRIGKAALHALLETWLARLAPGAAAHLVVGRNLGADSLHSWLETQGWSVVRAAARSGYRLLTIDYPERTMATHS